MRMRKKPNLLPRMERCAQLLIRDPRQLRGHWRDLKPDAADLRKGTIHGRNGPAAP